jgi:hypothetical protein
MTSLYFKNRGTIPSLESFVWTSHWLPSDHNLEFLRSNIQLSKLKISFAASPMLLEEQLLPLLSRSFSRLKSLSLVWDDTRISDSALELISSLQSLEQICLSAGAQFGWRHNWLIDHDAMRRHLVKLTGLRKIAFCRDSYDKSALAEIDSYYEFQIPMPEEGELSPAYSRRGASLAEIWESQHQHRILVEADKYIRILPKLEWLYFGQLPMSVIKRHGESDEENDGPDEESDGPDEENDGPDEENGGSDIMYDVFDKQNDDSDRQSQSLGGGERQAVVLSEERDDCRELLRQIFGVDGCLFKAF